MGRLDVQLRGVDPRGNLGRVAEAARQFVFQQLLACEFGDHWALRFVNGIAWKVEAPAMKAIAVQHHAIRLKTKTGDNSTAVEWLLVPPGTYQADIVLVKLRESLAREVLEVPDEEPVAVAAVAKHGPGRTRHVLQSPMSEVGVYNPTSEIEEILKEPVMSSVPHPVVSAGKNGTPEAKPLLGGPMHTTAHAPLPQKSAAQPPAWAPQPATPVLSSHTAILESLRALADSAGRSDARAGPSSNA